jgi:hypothetical protein
MDDFGPEKEFRLRFRYYSCSLSFFPIEPELVKVNTMSCIDLPACRNLRCRPTFDPPS